MPKSNISPVCNVPERKEYQRIFEKSCAESHGNSIIGVGGVPPAIIIILRMSSASMSMPPCMPQSRRGC